MKGLQPVLCPSCSFSWALYFALWLSRGGRLPATLFGHIQSTPPPLTLVSFWSSLQREASSCAANLSSHFHLKNLTIFGLFWVNLSRRVCVVTGKQGRHSLSFMTCFCSLAFIKILACRGWLWGWKLDTTAVLAGCYCRWCPPDKKVMGVFQGLLAALFYTLRE